MLAGSVALTGVLVAVAGTSASAEPTAGCTARVNPMAAAAPTGSASGFTVRATHDLTLGNSELEGSFAAGHLFTTTGQNDYRVTHSVAGDSGYTLPTVDGAPLRALVEQWSGAGRIVKIDSTRKEGGTVPGQMRVHDLSYVNAPPFVGKGTVPTAGVLSAFGPGGTVLAAVGAGNQDPQLQDLTQVFDAANPSARAAQPANSYFPSDDGAAGLAAVYANEAGRVVPTSTTGERTLTLQPGTDNWTTLSALGGSGKIRLSLAGTPLYVQVTDADVDPAGVVRLPSLVDHAQSSFILYDLSTVTKAVTLESEAPVSGAIFAPGQSVSIVDRLFEGQILARDFTDTASGDEIHTYLFGGTVGCAPADVPPIGTSDPAPTDPPVTDPAPSDPPATDPAPTDPAPAPVDPATGVRDQAVVADVLADPSAADPADGIAVDTEGVLAETGAQGPLKLAGVALAALWVGGVLVFLRRRRAR